MKNPLADIQAFMHAVEYMRERQRSYFTTRNDTNLRMAKSAEREVDQQLLLLSKKGYKAEKPVQSKQQNIF